MEYQAAEVPAEPETRWGAGLSGHCSGQRESLYSPVRPDAGRRSQTAALRNGDGPAWQIGDNRSQELIKPGRRPMSGLRSAEHPCWPWSAPNQGNRASGAWLDRTRPAAQRSASCVGHRATGRSRRWLRMAARLWASDTAAWAAGLSEACRPAVGDRYEQSGNLARMTCLPISGKMLLWATLTRRSDDVRG